MKRTFLLILCTLITISGWGSYLEGKLTKYPNSMVKLYCYLDVITDDVVLIGEYATDANGYFATTDIDMPLYKRYKVVVGNNSVEFFGMSGFVYKVEDAKNGLRITEDKRNINYYISQMNSDISVVQSKFDDPVFSSKIGANSSQLLLQSMDSVCNHYVKVISNLGKGNAMNVSKEFDPLLLSTAITNQEVAKLLEYNYALGKMRYLVARVAFKDLEVAKKSLDELEKKCFVSSPLALDNFYYIKSLEYLKEVRMNLGNFEHFSDHNYTMVEQGLSEAGLAKNKKLKELSTVLALKIIYDNRWYEGTMSFDKYNSVVDSISRKISTPIFKKATTNLISINKKYGIGSNFPVVKLLNLDENMVDIDSVKEPYILIDFWTTWCPPCKETMEKFPELMNKYKGKLMIVSVSVDANFNTMKDYLVKNDYSGKWMALYNGLAGGYLEQLHITGYPKYFILDKNRKIVSMPQFDEVIAVLEKQIN